MKGVSGVERGLSITPRHVFCEGAPLMTVMMSHDGIKTRVSMSLREKRALHEVEV